MIFPIPKLCRDRVAIRGPPLAPPPEFTVLALLMIAAAGGGGGAGDISADDDTAQDRRLTSDAVFSSEYIAVDIDEVTVLSGPAGPEAEEALFDMTKCGTGELLILLIKDPLLYLVCLYF
jgi:hypothetical protein